MGEILGPCLERLGGAQGQFEYQGGCCFVSSATLYNLGWKFLYDITSRKIRKLLFIV